jgi:integrase
MRVSPVLPPEGIMRNQLRRRITKSVVAAASPKPREYLIHDTEIAGYALRVRPSGSTSFVFMYRSPGGRKGRARRVTIKADNPEIARREAKRLAAQHHGGADPARERAEKRNGATVGEFLNRFVEDHVSTLKPKTAHEYRRIVERILKPKLGRLAASELATKDVAEAYQGMRDRPTQAAAAVRVLSSAMSLAEEWGLRPAGSNPARIRLKGTRRRERLFTANEVVRLMRAIAQLEKDRTNSRAQSLGLRLLFSTGCRGGEICDLQWDNVDLLEGSMRWPDSKTGHVEKPVTSETKPLLERAWRDRLIGVPWVIPGANGGQMRIETLEAAFERAMAHAGVEAREKASLHLIRHWFASKTYTDKSIPLPVAMKIVGHTSVATAMRYSHVERDEVRQAAEEAASRRARDIKAAGRRGGKVVRLADRVS